MAKRLKVVQAGPLIYEYLVPITNPDDGKKRRSRERQLSTEAQQFMNHTNSWKELELYIAENFFTGAHVVTYTFDDANLPPSKAAASVPFGKYVRKLRAARRSRGETLKYIYAPEGFHGLEHRCGFEADSVWEDRRVHLHVIINSTGNDYEELRSLWEYGSYIRIEPFDIHYCAELAQYMTKEAREFGRAKPGERTWRASRNLEKYKVEYDDVRDSMTLTAPHGAVDFQHIEKPNPAGFGELVCTRYLLLESEKPPVYSYNTGRRKNE